MHNNRRVAKGVSDIELRIAKAVEARPEAGKLLELLAFLQPENIPIDLVSDKVMEPPIRDAALRLLAEFSLLDYSKQQGGRNTVSIDLDVQQAMRNRLKLEMREDNAACSALHLIADAFPPGDQPKETHHWPVCEKLLPHALHILGMMPDDGDGAAPATYLLCQTGRYLNAISDFARAEPILRRALIISETSYGSDHPAMAIHLNNLAELLKSTKRFDEAEAVCRRAISINEQTFGPDHLEVTTDLSNLTEMLMRESTRRLLEAEPLAARVVETLRLHEKKTGQRHPKYMLAYNNLVAIRQQLAEQLNENSQQQLEHKSQISECSQIVHQRPKAVSIGEKELSTRQSSSPPKEWLVVQNGKQSGPFSQQKMHQLISEGKISSEDLIRRKNVSNWLRFDQLILHSHDLLRMMRDENNAADNGS